MLKNLFLMLLLGMAVLALGAVELKFSGNQIISGQNYISMFKNGTITLRQSSIGNYARMIPHFTTQAKGNWFALNNAACQSRMAHQNRTNWNYTASVPLNNEGGVLSVKQEVNVTPFNTIDVEVSWDKPAKSSDLRNAGLFMYLPIKNISASGLILDSKKINVVNETKYGWHKSISKNPQLVLFSGQKGKEMTLNFAGKYNIIISSYKDKYMLIRFNVKDSLISYTIRAK